MRKDQDRAPSDDELRPDYDGWPGQSRRHAPVAKRLIPGHAFGFAPATRRVGMNGVAPRSNMATKTWPCHPATRPPVELQS